jgi:ribosomal protein S18 acetylase RimI-like enzyme
MDKYNISYEKPSAEDYVQLRVKIGWGKTDLAMVEKSLCCSLFHVTIYAQSQLVAMGRVVGDGAMFFYIQDVVVDPNHQSQGLGKTVMENIERFLKENAKGGSTIGLLAAQGKEDFYKTWEYLDRTGTPLGRGMCKFI